MGGRTQFCLGCPEAWSMAAPNAFKKELAQIGETDGFAVRRKGSVIFIVANEPKGILNGVYDFLEQNTDIVFHRPNAPAIYSKVPDLTITKYDYVKVPKFIQRGFQINVEAQYEPSELWLARNMNNVLGSSEPRFLYVRGKYGMWQSYGGGHNLFRWIPPKKYSESNPDFFPLIDGTRRFKMPAQLCFTNPKLADEFVKNILEQYRNAPSHNFYKT